MKNKIYTLFVLLISFCFFSCSNLLEEREITNSTSDTYVSFNFGNERAIVSTATPADYTYTLKGTSNEETLTLCEKLSYADFISKHFRLTHGEWTFEITAYKNNIAVFGGSVTQTLVEGNNDVSFTLRAVTGGMGSLSITLKYPASADVKTILAGIYDSIPTSIPEVASAPSECTVFSPETSASSVTFECDSIPSGENKFVEFFIYDSQDFCIGSYLESVFLTVGDSIAVEREVAVNSFAATVELKVAGEPWIDSGCKIFTVRNGQKYIMQNTEGTCVYTTSLPLGKYKVYKLNIDTGVELNVTVTGIESAILNLESKEYYATVSNIDTLIDSLTADSTIVIDGELNNNDFNLINKAIKKSNVDIKLDLRNVLNLAVLPDGAFAYNSKLENIILPDIVTFIGNFAFEGCQKLENIELPDSVTSIGSYAFEGCQKLENIELPDSVISIGDSAFENCKNLESIVIPKSVTTIGYSSLYNCTQLQSINYTGTDEQWNNITKRNSWNTNCPSNMRINYNYYGVKATSDNVMEVVSGLTSDATIVMSGDITSDDISKIKYAIQSSSYNIKLDLRKVTNLTALPNFAFQDCTKLVGIEFPNTVLTIGAYAFLNCQYLEVVELPTSVESISEGTFSECSNLQFVKLSPSIKNINNSTFSGCSSLQSIEIPEFVTSIGAMAFHSCSSLQSIELPDSVLSIADNAFYECLNLQNIKIPDSVTTIGIQAFCGCENLQTINYMSTQEQWNESIEKGEDWNKNCSPYMEINCFFIKATAENIAEVISGLTHDVTIIMEGAITSVTINVIKVTINNLQQDIKLTLDLRKVSNFTTLPSYAFQSCNKLIGIKLPDSVLSIGMRAFDHCTNLEYIELPDSITTMGHSIFYCCTKLKRIKLSASITSIESHVFYYCTNLQSIELPDSVTSIGDNAFRSCKNLKSIELSNSLTSIGQSAFYECENLLSIEIPDTVTSIGSYAFYNCKNLGSIKLSDSLTSITDYAFYGCKNLKRVELSDTVTSIGNYSFYGCQTLNSFTISNYITSIGNHAFYCCYQLPDITIPDTVTSIGVAALSYCKGLKSIEIPDSVTSIGNNAFYGCEGLRSVKLSDSITSINDYVFYGCTNLESIELPALVTTIGDEAFSVCTKLKSIDIGNSVESIGKRAFYLCYVLQNIVIPDTVTYIGEGAFYDCKSIESIKLPNSVTTLCDNVFYDCDNLRSIELSNSITTIGETVFKGCKSLESIVIPNSVISVGYRAFCACINLESIELSDSLTSIADYAFYGCEKINCIEISDTLTSIGDYAFYYCKELHVINYVGSQDQWDAITKAQNWNSYCPSDMVINYNYQAE